VPVAHGARVGELGLAGKLLLGRPHRVVGGPDAASRRGQALCAGGDFQAAQLLLGERGLLEGVVLFAGEQMPEQAGQLARGGDDRDAMAAAGADIVDVGGESTRPRSQPTPQAEELKRVLPVVRGLTAAGVRVSVDTRHAATMKAVLDAVAAAGADALIERFDRAGLAYGAPARLDQRVTCAG